MSDLLNYTTSAVVADYDRLREHCGQLDLPGIAVVTLTGDDRKGWLQGQVTNNLRTFDAGWASAFCFCEATGHLLSVADAWALPDRVVLTVPRDTLPAVLRRVEQMVVMEDVEARDSSEDLRLFSIQGPKATSCLSEILTLPTTDAGIAEINGATVTCLRSNRTGMGGWDVLVPVEASGAIAHIQETFAPISEEAYEIARVEAGIPRWGVDMGVKTMPPELGPAFEARHVSYNKGCYMGQEVLMRIHSRGHTNRTWMGLVADEPLEPGAPISHDRRADAGHVCSSVFSPDYGHIGAAMLRTEAAFDRETVVVRTERGEVEAEVRQMPILRFD